MYRNSTTKEDLCADIESNKISLIKILSCHYCRNQQVQNDSLDPFAQFCPLLDGFTVNLKTFS